MIFAVLLILFALLSAGVGILSLKQLKQENQRRERRGKSRKKPGVPTWSLFGVLSGQARADDRAGERIHFCGGSASRFYA